MGGAVQTWRRPALSHWLPSPQQTLWPFIVHNPPRPPMPCWTSSWASLKTQPGHPSLCWPPRRAPQRAGPGTLLPGIPGTAEMRTTEDFQKGPQQGCSAALSSSTLQEPAQGGGCTAGPEAERRRAGRPHSLPGQGRHVWPETMLTHSAGPWAATGRQREDRAWSPSVLGPGTLVTLE